MLRGSCACQKIRYQIDGPFLEPVTYCHCWRCRKHSGTSFGTTVGLDTTALHFTEGENLLSSWQSSPGVYRYFASCCGSPIYKSEAENPDVIGFRLGTLDQDPSLQVSQHYMTDAKAPWVTICDTLEQIEGGETAFDYN